MVVIGSEILSGRTQDKNIAFIGRYLESLGIALAEVSVLPNIEQRITVRVSAYAKAHDYVFTTGGANLTDFHHGALVWRKAGHYFMSARPFALNTPCL